MTMKPNTFLTGALCALLCWACAPKAQNNSTLDTIFARKSVRTYTDQAVSPGQVETLLKAAMAAPSGINLQPWRFVVVTDAATKATLAGPRNSMITQAPVVIVICGETTWTHKPWGEPDAPEVTEPNRNWTADCAAATENLLLAAEAMGLGAVWTACYPYEERMSTTIETLGIPENVLPYCIVPVGYPGGEETPKDKWKPENIHYEKW